MELTPEEIEMLDAEETAHAKWLESLSEEDQESVRSWDWLSLETEGE